MTSSNGDLAHDQQRHLAGGRARATLVVHVFSEQLWRKHRSHLEAQGASTAAIASRAELAASASREHGGD